MQYDIKGKGILILRKDLKSDSSALAAPIETKTTYALISDAARQLDDRAAKKTDAYKLQSGARRVLACLTVRDGVSQLDLIRATHLKAPTISLIVQKMEHDGLISRKTDDLDMRLTRVYLTDKGRNVNADVCAAVADLENDILCDFSDAEKEQLHDLLVRLYRNLESSAEA